MVIYLWYTLAVCIFGFNLTLCCLECLSWSQDAWAQSLAPNCQFSHHQSCLSIFFTFVYSFNDICLLCFRTSTWPSLHSWAILNWSHFHDFTIFELIIESILSICVTFSELLFWRFKVSLEHQLLGRPSLSFLPMKLDRTQPKKILDENSPTNWKMWWKLWSECGQYESMDWRRRQDE